MFETKLRVNNSNFAPVICILSLYCQTLCSKIETENCGPDGLKKYISKIPGFEVTKCGVACCQTPMCNKMDLVKPKPTPKALAAYTTASLLVSGISFTLALVV